MRKAQFRLLFNEEDVWLQPRSILGELDVVDVLEPYINNPKVGLHEMMVRAPSELIELAGGPTQEINVVYTDMESSPQVDLGGLDLYEEDLRKVRSLLDKHNDVFGKDGDDIGYCDAIPHQIVRGDDIPTRVPHRRIHHNQWEEFIAHLEKWLKKLGVLQ